MGMNTRDLRLVTLGALGGLGAAVALGAARLQPEPVGAAANDMRLTWSADGRTVYLWRVVGNTVEYQSTWRAPGVPKPQVGDDGHTRDDTDKDKKDKPERPVRTPRPDRE
jgi:hypothetical protein